MAKTVTDNMELVLLDPNAMLADLVVLRCHARLDLVLVPGVHADVGVAG